MGKKREFLKILSGWTDLPLAKPRDQAVSASWRIQPETNGPLHWKIESG
jgi:hypothetical protein